MLKTDQGFRVILEKPQKMRPLQALSSIVNQLAKMPSLCTAFTEMHLFIGMKPELLKASSTL